MYPLAMGLNGILNTLANMERETSYILIDVPGYDPKVATDRMLFTFFYDGGPETYLNSKEQKRRLAIIER